MKIFFLKLDDSEEVYITVNIATVVVAFSKITLPNGKKIKSKSTANGSIPSTFIGTTSQIAGKKILIEHIFDFSEIDEDNWKQEEKNMKIEYLINGEKRKYTITNKNSFRVNEKLYLTCLILLQ